MFIYKTSKELEALTTEELDQYKADLKAYEAELQKTAITTEVETQMKTGKADLEKFLGEEIANQIAEIKTNKDIRRTILDEVIEKKAEIIKMIKGTSYKEIEIKANTTRASILNSASQDLLTTIGQLGVKRRSLYDIFGKVNMNIGNDGGKVVYHDWDEATTVRAAAMVAEGTQFPESTAKFAKYSIDLKKIGDTLPVSEEFGEDEASAAAELEMFIDVNINSVIDNQLVNGDGVGLNLTGLMNSIPVYVPIASGIVDANIKDLVGKVRTAIVFNRGSKYQPDIVAMNANTIDRLKMKKDGNKNYIFPDIENIGPLEIIEDNNILDNQLAVGDSRFARIYEKGGVAISRVYVGTQAIEDIVTIKGRKRMLFLIRNVDKTGFMKVTDITAALTTLAT